MVMEPKQATHYNYFVVYLLCSYYVTDMIKKLELRLLVVIVLFRLNLGSLKLLCPKSVNRCRKQLVSTPANVPYERIAKKACKL